jgi:two-component system sensor histidine kinase/response regulator
VNPPGLTAAALGVLGLGVVNFLALWRQRRANERLAAELAARRRSEEAALAAVTARTSFLAHMSHEIRTPMVGILGASELLLQTSLTARQQGLASTIDSSTRALLGILNNVLDLSKIDAGRLAVTVEPVDAHVVCEDVTELFATPAAQRGIDLVVAWSAEVPRRAIGDPLRLRQVLVNLVGNAIKFTERGHVAVRAALVESAANAPPRLCISVEDTGIGVPAEQLATLFAPFVQATAETTRRYGGSGLGLAISKQLVELMGGTIGATSTPGSGSAFWFTLPLALPDATVPSPGHALAGLRVLVVSDRPQTVAVLTAVLGGWQAEVTTASSVATACDGGARPADALLVDVRVQDADALWVDGKLRPELPRRTILLVAPQEAALRLCGDVDVTIPLPLREQHLLDALLVHGPSPRAAPSGPCPAAHVLVADDVEINREVVRQQLEQIGCMVDLAASGREAVAQCRAHLYDLVLMDCHMADLDGFQATETIRAERGPNRATPIVALTASAIADERERCATSGMNDYLTKPISREELSACLDRFVGGSGTTAKNPPAMREPDAPPVVLDVEATLDRIGGNTQLFDRLITIFRRQTPPLVGELREALGGGDTGRVRDAAHKLNGSLRSVGGHAAQAVAAMIEQRALEGTLDDAMALYEALTAELARLDDAIGGYLADGRPGHDD